MSDRYQDFVSSPVGKLLVKNLGLPNPVTLDRYVAGSPLVDGSVLVGDVMTDVLVKVRDTVAGRPPELPSAVELKVVETAPGIKGAKFVAVGKDGITPPM